MPASTITSATSIPCSRNSSAAALEIARTPKEPAAHRPRPAIALREEPPVTWTTVAGRPCASSQRPLPDKNENAARAGAAAHASNPSRSASAITPPPNGPCRAPPYADAAFTTRSIGPLASAAAASADSTAAGSVTSPGIAKAPAAVIPASVSSDRATAATAQPSSCSTSITARPRLRAPNTSALRPCG